jgi:anti-sigma factor RsiW
MSCSYVTDVEDLSLGALSRGASERSERGGLASERERRERDREAHVRAHLATCAECREALLTFENERALFQRRASAMVPVLEASLPAAPRVAVLGDARLAGLARLAHGVPLAIACAAAIVLVTNLGRLGRSAHAGSSSESTTTATESDKNDGSEIGWCASGGPALASGIETMNALCEDPRRACEGP